MSGPGANVVSRLRRRLRGTQAAGVGAWVLAAAAAALLGVLVADAILVLPVEARRRAWWLVLAAAGAATGAGWLSWRHLTDLRVARLLERQREALGTALTNAVQLAAQPGRTPAEMMLRAQAVEYGRQQAAGLSVWPLARRRVAAAGAVVGVVGLLWAVGLAGFGTVFEAVWPRLVDPYGDHPPYSRVRIAAEAERAEVLYGGQCEVRATAAGGAVEKLILVAEGAGGRTEAVMFRRPDRSFFQTLTNLREPTRFYVTDGRARSRRVQIAIRYTPQVELVRVTQTPPAYTGLPASADDLKTGDLAVPKRTQLGLRVTSNRPLGGGELELTPLLGGEKKTVSLRPTEDDPHAVEGSFQADVAATLSLVIMDVEGVACPDPVRGRIRIVPDRPPRIDVVEPNPMALATPETTIPVRVLAEDDYGVSGVLWFRGINQSIERPADFVRAPAATAKRLDAGGGFALAELGVRPGDKLQYFFEAVDNDPDGPNVATSRMFTLEIISTEQHAELLRRMAAQQALFEQYSRLTQQLRRLLERAETLGEQTGRAAAPGASADDAQAARNALHELERDLDEYRKALADARQIPLAFDVERMFHEELARQQSAADAIARTAGELGAPRPDGPIDPRQVQRIIAALQSLAGDMSETVGEPAELIASVAALLYEADLFAQLTLRQQEIARLTRRFENKTGVYSRLEQMELQDLFAAQEHNRKELAELLERLPDRLDALPPGEPFDALRGQVSEFLDAAVEAKIIDDMIEALLGLGNQDGPGGHAAAEAAYRKMEALCAKCDAESLLAEGNQCLGFRPKLTQSLGDSLRQILSAMGAGGSGGSGYGLLGNNVGLYGPNVQLNRQAQGGGRREDSPFRSPGGRSQASAAGEAHEESLPPQAAPGRVRVQTDAPFPLQYRDVVGGYFRRIAESQE